MKARPATHPPAIPFEKRIEMRFDKVFPVLVGSEIYGDSPGIARNISAGGMLVEMMEPLPLGSVVTIHFRAADGRSEIVARAEVKHHYCLNFSQTGEPASTRGVGLRFIEFIDQVEIESFTRSAVIH
jgi:PilZ domain-containing protein